MIVLAAVHDQLGDALAQIAAALQIPVLLAALGVLVLCALELGRYASEQWQRRVRARDVPLRELAHAVAQEPGLADAHAGDAPTAFAAQALHQIAAGLTARRPLAIEHALADYELAAQRRLDRTRMLVRAGPAIGLMGTLIPLAPGLAALGRGDVASLAGDLRTAFAATVVGLLVGTIAFALTLSRTRMYSEDLTALERATETLAPTVADAVAPAVVGEGAA